MKNILTTILTILVANFSIFAQSLIEGSISNVSGEPVATTTINFNHLEDTQLSKIISTDEDGYFIIEGLADGNYQMEIVHAEYEKITVNNFVFPRDTDQVLGLIMEPTSINSTATAEKKQPENNLVHTTIH